MRKLSVFVLLLCVMTTSVAFINDRTIMTPTRDISIHEVSTKEVRAAIIKACTILTWAPKEQDKNTIRATIVVRGRHTVVVDIPYTADSYSIKYVHSINMDAKPNGTIHRSYNNWVVRLADTINQELLLSNL